MYILERDDEPLEDYTKHASRLSFSPGGHYLVSRADDTTSIVQDINTREVETDLFKRHTQRFTTINFSLSETSVVSTPKDETILFLNTFTMEKYCERYNVEINYTQLHTHTTSSYFSREDTSGYVGRT